jgi:hypothetical protein
VLGDESDDGLLLGLAGELDQPVEKRRVSLWLARFPTGITGKWTLALRFSTS